MSLDAFRQRRSVKRAGIVLVSLVSFLLVWSLLSQLQPGNLPSPSVLFSQMWVVLEEPGPRRYTGYHHLEMSLRRVGVTLTASLLLSTVVGALMGMNREAETIGAAWLPVSLTLPDVVVVLVAMIILGFDGQAIIVAITITATPFGVVNVWQGTKALDTGLLEMARSFDSSRYLVTRYILLPHLLSYLFASTRYMLGMIWKLVLVGEAFGTTDGIGAIVRFWFNQGGVTEILSYVSLFVFVMFGIEYGVLRPLELRASAWRGE